MGGWALFSHDSSACAIRKVALSRFSSLRSSPAYVFMFIEAMADEAVAAGMPRKQAYEFAAQSVLGSAKMVLETGKHPGELKDMVCSPGGTTIEAVQVLEDRGFRSSVMHAVSACVEKCRTLG